MNRSTTSFALALGASIGCACCGVSGPNRTVSFGNQTNLIIWNAATQTEHFVRNAMFNSEAEHLGFIAPTPTEPQVYAATNKALTLVAALQPWRETKSLGQGGFGGSGGRGVEVLQVVDVSGYEATVLRASDSQSLANWMAANGYRTTPGIQKWTDFYIRKQWYLTAFKVKKGDKATETGAIRMTFQTGRPFNPYYVPAENAPKGKHSLLTVFFVAQGRYVARLDNGTSPMTRTWSARVPDETRKQLAAELKMPLSHIPDDSQVGSYRDYNFPRTVQSDLWFDADLSGTQALALQGSVMARTMIA